MEAGPFTKDQAIQIVNRITEDYKGERFDGSDGCVHFIYTVCIAPYHKPVRNELMALFYQHLNKGCITAHDIRSYNENCIENEYTVVAVIGIKGRVGLSVNFQAVQEFSIVSGLYYFDILKS